MRHIVLTTCGDTKVLTSNKKHVDPALCLYVEARVLCTIDNEYLTGDVSHGNKTLYRVIGIKMKDHGAACRWKKYYRRKVWIEIASNNEYIQLEHYPKSNTCPPLSTKLSVLKIIQRDGEK